MNKERMDELFLKACKGVIKQKRQSKDINGTCMYRNGNLKCAVGHMIPDKMYTKEMEYHTFLNLCSYVEPWVNDDFAKHFGYDSQKEMERYVSKGGHVFGKLQDIHDELPDDEFFVKNFKRNAISLARKFKLKNSVEYLKSV